MAALPVLYSFRRCPYAMRARLAIAASGVRCELREVVLRNKPAAMLQASPKGTVPVLVLPQGDARPVIDESLDIMRWALAQADPQGWLAPQRGSLADMLALIGECDGVFKHHLDRYKYPQRHIEIGAAADDSALAAFSGASRDGAAGWLAGLESRLGDGYLCGSSPALADMAILPFVRQFAHVDDDWFTGWAPQGVRRWLVQWEEGALFAAVMPKLAPWQEGEPGVLFP